jgi:hypothetical protein
MNSLALGIILTLAILPFFTSDSDNIAYAQVTINVTDTEPCFLNYTAGVDMWDNCGFEEDYLAAALLPFEWVTGGLFSIVIVSIIILMSYIKYHNIIYPILIGIVMMPVSYFAFPDQFVSFAVILAFVGVGTLIGYILVKQTKEN